MPDPNIVQKGHARIVVVGAGAAGLAAAWALARSGCIVTLVDAAEPGRGALWASGGMLAGGFEACIELEPGHPLGPDFAALTAQAGEAWSRWASMLGREAIAHERRGALFPAFTAEESERASAALDRARRYGVDARRLSADEIAAAEPSLAPTLGGVLFTGDGQLDNRALGDVLLAACKAQGVRVIRADAAIETEAGAPRLILDADHRIEADAIVLASGAGEVQGAPDIARTEPVKGQMVAFAAARPLAPSFVVRAASIYLAAKPGVRLVAGATSEPGVSDLETEDAQIEALVAAARRAVPGLAASPVIERWAGLRPRAADSMPVIGEAAPGVFTLSGGYRNGVLLAPVMADALAVLITTGAAPEEVRPFGPDRLSLQP